MNRRNCLKAMAAALPAASMVKGADAPPMQLHCDLELDPAKEKELIENFRNVFKPAISQQPGFASVTLLKLRPDRRAKEPARFPYRLIISFQTEEQRMKWVATEAHRKAWPTIENCLVGQKYVGQLYDAVE